MEVEADLNFAPSYLNGLSIAELGKLSYCLSNFIEEKSGEQQPSHMKISIFGEL